LLNGAGNYSPHSMRCGAAMLGAVGNAHAVIAKLAIWERYEAVIHFIAECERSFEPHNPYWSGLLERLPACHAPKEGVLPHPTRFVEMSGDERGVGKNHPPVAASLGRHRRTNAEIIATTLDGLFDHEVSRVVYGRTALPSGLNTFWKPSAGRWTWMSSCGFHASSQ
jgi:hypothetical protein